MMERFDLMNTDYRLENDLPIIWLISRDAQRARKMHKIEGFKPHGWVADPLGTERDLFDRPISELITKTPGDIGRLRKGYDYHDECDIKFQWRYLIDKKILCGYGVENGNLTPMDSMGIPPKIGFLDCEVETPPEIMARPQNPSFPICSFQFSSNYHKDLTLFMLNTQIEGEALPIPKEFLGCRSAITRPVIFNLLGKSVTVNPIVYLFDSEKYMIHDVTQWTARQEFDALSGWNSNFFDMPYWIRRAKFLHVDLHKLSPFGEIPQCDNKLDPQTGKMRMEPFVKGMSLLDLMKLYQKWTGGRQPIVKGRPFGLTYDFHIVMEYECGFKYVDLGDKVIESRIHHPIEWLEYCTGDAFALRLLDEQKHIISYFDLYRRNVGGALEDSIHNSRLIDRRLLRLRDRPLPTKRPFVKTRVQGAVVFPPKIGIHESVAVVDDKSLYPSAIVTRNISPETLDPNGDIVVGPMEDGTILRFKSKPPGILSKAVQYDMTEREKYRQQLRGLDINSPKYEDVKQLETLHKFLACSYYGVTGYENFRLYSDPVRKAITFLGREGQKQCKTDLEDAGYEVLYGDTDSMYVQLHSATPLEGKIVEGIMNNTLKRIAWRRGATMFIEAKLEHFCKRIIFVPKLRKNKRIASAGAVSTAAKKRYAYTDEKDNLFVVGMAPRRSSTPEVTRNLMMEWLELVLKKKDVQGAVSLIKTTWEKLPEMPLNKVGIPKGIKKERYGRYKTVEIYKGELHHRVKIGEKKVWHPIANPWQTGCEYMTKRFGKVFREDKKPLLIYMLPQIDVNSSDLLKGHEVVKESIPEAVCITENDVTLPEELRPYVDWETMREKVLKAHFKSLFEAIGLEWFATTRQSRLM